MFNLDGPATQVVSFDVDGDGRLDLVIPQESKDQVVISLGTDHQSFNLIKIPAKSPRKVAFGDVNSDGLVDLIVLNPADYVVDIFLQQRRTLATDALFLTTPAQSVKLASVGSLLQLGVTDFPPADGKPDIVVAGVEGFAILSNKSF